MQSTAFQVERLCTGHPWTFSPSELQVWKLSDSRQSQKHLFFKISAVHLFSKISAVPLDLRRCHGGKKEAGASMAFSGFKHGLAAEVSNRMAALCSTMAAVVGALQMERQHIPATRTISSLQQLCSRYSSDANLLGKRKQSGLACL